jgi:catechol 2,3-dioxygenase-like lactoylglutathione lyase family enzyme
MEILQTIPLLRIFDIAKAKDFYIDFLGFKTDWEHRFEPGMPLYMQISRGECILHLTEHHGDCCPGATVFIRVKGLDDFHAEISGKQYRYARPAVELAPWNAKLVQVSDPFGNRLRFNEDL